MIDRKQVKSLTVLGWNFGLHILRAMIPRKKINQVELFKGYFSKDWITAFTAEEINQVYNFQQCTVCGLCQEVCTPAWESGGKFLGPEHLAACAGRSQPEYISDADDFFRCTLCARCEPACPEEVKISDLARLMRRWIFRVDPSATWSLFPQVKQNLDQFQNPFGKPGAAPKAQAGKILLFPGCRETALGDPEKWLALCKKSGLDAKLFSAACCGGLLEEIGADNLAPGLDRLIAQGPELVLTICPHCFYQLRRKLPPKIAVKFILEMIPENAVPALKPKGKIIYHDPCFLTRKMGMGGLPRLLLQRAGAKVVEFSANNGLADCCGGGGGLLWYEPAHASRIAGRRVEEAQKLGAEMLLTECGICQELLAKAGRGQIPVKRLSELFI